MVACRIEQKANFCPKRMLKIIDFLAKDFVKCPKTEMSRYACGLHGWILKCRSHIGGWGDRQSFDLAFGHTGLPRRGWLGTPGQPPGSSRQLACGPRSQHWSDYRDALQMSSQARAGLYHLQIECRHQMWCHFNISAADLLPLNPSFQVGFRVWLDLS